MDFNDVLDNIERALKVCDGDVVAKIYNMICDPPIEYVADGIWDEKE